MANNNKTVTLTVDVQAQLSDLRGQVGKIQDMLKGLKMPDSLTKSANSSVENLLERIKKIEDYTDGNKLKLVDERKVQSQFDAIQKDFKHLVDKLNEGGAKIKIGDSKSADALRKGINDYRKGVEAATKAVEEQRKKVEELQKELNRKQAGVTRAEQYQKDAQAMVDAAEKAFKEVEDAEAKYLKKNEDKAWSDAQRKANLRKHLAANGLDPELSKTLNPEAEKRLSDARDKLAKKTKNLQNAQEKMRVEGGAVQKQFEKENKILEQYENTLKQLSEQELKKVKEELTKLQEGGGVSFKFNPEDIKSVEDLEEKLKEVDDQDMSSIKQVLEKIGLACRDGAQGADSLNTEIDENVNSFKELNSTLDLFKSKTAYFFGMANAANLLRRAVNAAFNTVKDLDEVMTETAVVTDFSVGDMWAQLPEYTRRANELGVSIHDAYEAATLYYQQGLKTNQVMAVSNETLKMARIANLDAAEATSRMTNALRGFNMEINEMNAQRVNDVYSELAAITAADTDEISTAMTKVASLAHNANMEFETTSAFLAQMIETTRESAETAGTALKTVIARFSEVKELYNQGDLLGTDEEGEEIDVNKVSIALRSAGINLNEYLTGAKGLDAIFIELASKWDKLDMVQQRYIATMAAGSRQQSRFIAMMSDYKRTTELVTAANTSAGASQRQFEKTLDSLQSKLAQLKNSWDTFLMGIADDTIIKTTIDLLKLLLDTINKIFEGVDKITEAYTGGAGGAVIRISSLFILFKLGNVIVTQSIALFNELAASKMEDAIATKTLAIEEGKENVVQKAGLVTRIKSIVFGKKDVATKGAQAVATEGAAAATLHLVVVTAIYTIAIVALIAAVAGFIKMWKAFQSDSPADIFEDAQKSTEAATSAADDLANSYNNLNNSLDSLDEKYESLEKLTRGSQAWRDSVREINDAVLDLMANYDGLEIKNENGVLKVVNQDAVLDEYSKRYADAQTARLGAQLHQVQAEENKKYVDIEEYLYKNGNGGTGFYTDVSKDLVDKVAKQLATTGYGKTMGETQVNVGAALGSLGTITEETVEELRKYGKTLNEIEQKTRSYYDALAATAISNADLAEGTEELAQSFMNARRLDSLYIEEFNAMEGELFTDIKETLARELNFSSYGEYKQQHGEISDESARVQLAQIRAQKRATENVEEFSKKISKLPEMVQKIYSREDKHGLTSKEVSAELEYLDYDFGANQIGEAAKVYSRAYNLWTQMGKEAQDAFGSFADFQADYIDAIFGSYGALKDAEDAFISFGGSAEAFKEKLDAGSLKQLGQNLQNIFTASGSEGAKIVQDEINTIVNELDTDKASEFIDILNGVDWSSANSINTLSDTLEGLKINIPDDQIEQLTKDMIDLGGATYKINFEGVMDQLEKIGTLAGRIKSGDQKSAGFSKDDMETAVAAGISKSDFYYNADDNTFTYIGNTVNDIYQALLEQTDVLIGKDALERQVENGNAFNRAYKAFGSKVDTSNEHELYRFLFRYIKEGGTDISEDAIHRRGGDLEGLQELYQRVRENADYLNQNTAALQEAEARSQQIADGLADIDQNVTDNNLEAVQAKARASGIDEEIYNTNANDINALAAITKEMAKASGLGLDIDSLNAYIKTLKKLNPELDDVLATQVAISNTRLNTGLQSLINSYDDWSKLITEDGIKLDDLDSITNEVYNNMKKDVNEVLGLNADLSDSFYTDAETGEMLERLIQGDTKALYELRAAAADEIFIDVELNDEALRGEVEGKINAIKDFIINEAPTMEVGAVINTGPFVDALNWMLRNTSLSIDQINKMFGNIGGFELEPIYGPMQVSVNGMTGEVRTYQVIIGYKNKTKAASIGGPSKLASYKNDSGSGGGSGGSEKNNTWENPYDELYNLTEKINESLRTREALERRYEKLVKKTSSTVHEVTKAYYDQIRQLRYEADLQKEMQAGRAHQLDNVANEYYMDSEGNRSTFASLGVTKYANYNKETGLLQIDWSGLEALEGDSSKVEEGKAAEAYISRLEELQDQFEEVRDKLWDIEDQIEELREEAIENYLTFEDRVMDALVNHYQKQIDEYTNLSDAIKSSQDEIIKGIQEEVNLSRQIRDNTQKEEDIADKEARLAYLRRDTSGANAMEIKKLEEEIGNARQSYSDTLIDQQLSDMQSDADAAAEQRNHQIEIMQNQLDVAKENGTLWGEVWDLINTATAADGTFSQNTELVTLLEESEAFQSLSVIGQMKWWEEVAEAFKRAQVGLSEAEGKYGVDANGDGTVSGGSSGATAANVGSGSSSGAASGSSSDISTEGAGHFAKIAAYEHPMAQMPSNEVKELQQALNDAGFTDNDGNELRVDGKYGSKTRQAVWKLQEKLGNVKVDGYYGPETRKSTLQSQFKAYATGGIADFTGPAWLDGTKSHPELVLNAKDTQNFIELKDILASMMSGQGSSFFGGVTNISVQVDSPQIASDYDLTNLADKIKKKIYEDSSYRNVNTINFMR